MEDEVEVVYAPVTHRPTSVEDLSKYQTEGQVILYRPQSPTPEQAEWYGTALACATRAGFKVDNECNVVRPKTEKELATLLESEQGTYDKGREDYVRVMRGGEYPKYNYAMQDYCRVEDLEAPPKPDET